MVYIEYSFKVAPLQPASDILIAELGEAGFESFVENKEGVLAYIQKEEYEADVLDGIKVLKNPNFKIDFEIKEIEQENWNATWETNFNPIKVGSQCMVRAPFHEKPDVKYDIVIEPKMSFGTGHHETTHMMLQFILDTDFKEKTVLDMGSGTGVLAILAEMRGAQAVDAIDIDNWCYLNALENVDRNKCTNITVLEGGAELLKQRRYDIIIANINRNILLNDMSSYVESLTKNGLLFLSGFYEDDHRIIDECCVEHGLAFKKKLKKNNWVAVKYVF
ncbi:50S ribosomal protein L11 methyltransferase [Maribacter algicola]|uniref:50S ribosomal protein L11 methyltransferase n=1 Tax=Meishania litoralis TaxID=3434685 RepID=A0ACC7LF94_9FLAO